MNLNAVVSDLKIMQSDGLPDSNTLQTMFESSAPPGFEGFRNFIPGYYDFQNALFKHVVRAKSGTPILSGLVYTVDMPDVLDHGRASVEAGQLRQVNFNKQYTVPPDVGHTITQMSQYATVNITEITETGFVFCLLDSSNQRVAGSISWTSTGY